MAGETKIPINLDVIAMDAILFEIGKLELEAGDILVVALPENWTAYMGQSLAENLYRLIPNKIMMVPNGTQLGVLRAHPEIATSFCDACHAVSGERHAATCNPETDERARQQRIAGQ